MGCTKMSPSSRRSAAPQIVQTQFLGVHSLLRRVSNNLNIDKRASKGKEPVKVIKPSVNIERAEIARLEFQGCEFQMPENTSAAIWDSSESPAHKSRARDLGLRRAGLRRAGTSSAEA